MVPYCLYIYICIYYDIDIDIDTRGAWRISAFWWYDFGTAVDIVKSWSFLMFFEAQRRGEVLDFEYGIDVTHCKPQPSRYHHASAFHPRFILYCISQASTIGVMIPVSPQTALAASGS